MNEHVKKKKKHTPGALFTKVWQLCHLAVRRTARDYLGCNGGIQNLASISRFNGLTEVARILRLPQSTSVNIIPLHL